MYPTPAAELLTDFSSKSDLIQALLCSCHIPVYFDSGKPARWFRDKLYVDGGLTDFIPVPPTIPLADTFRVCCFPIRDRIRDALGYENVAIAPDAFDAEMELPEHLRLRELLQMAFLPYSDELMTELIHLGASHAQCWVRCSRKTWPEASS